MNNRDFLFKMYNLRSYNHMQQKRDNFTKKSFLKTQNLLLTVLSKKYILNIYKNKEKFCVDVFVHYL